ncbi:MAG TPA: hypothetical protein VGK48_15070 [Terriglobia bacterium]
MPWKFRLAEYVRTQLLERKEYPPSVEVLTELFQTLFFASLKREENQAIACRVAFIDRNRPDPFPPERITADRWRYFSFEHELEFNARNLAKLSTAVDPWGTTLAVDLGEDRKLRIWGLIDQSVHYSTYIVKEASKGPEMPGMFQAVIQGIGEIGVYKTYLLLASLKHDTLVKGQRRVFQVGPIHSKLMRRINRFQQKVRKRVGSTLYDERDHWNKSLEDMWISALCRILIGIQRYGHGGAVLLSDDRGGLNKKYTLNYHRLATALTRGAARQIQHTGYSDQIGELIQEEADEVPMGLYLDDATSASDVTHINNEITGCVRFLASLSRVDGLIWLDSQLQLKGFGVEITVKEEPPEVLMAQDSEANKTKALDLNYFGTRHRSMVRYCAAHPESIGFVVSQDGDVRAITKVDERVIMWDNVRIQSLRNARRVSQ